MDIILLLVITTALTILFLSRANKIEPYYDITPYNMHWDIFKCLDANCIKDASYKCYRWCDMVREEGAATNCKTRCLDYADEMFDSLKLQNYTWSYLLPEFEHVTMLNK